MPATVPDVPVAFTEAVVDAFAQRTGPRFTLVLSGGPTARLCYLELASTEAIDWPLVDVYMGDERVVPPDDDDANQHLVRQTLVDHVPVGSFTPMDTTLATEACVAAYQRTMADVLAGPGIDLIHLGMGPDGHTASLFPHAPTLNAGPDLLVAATTDPNGVNPHPRLTVTLPVINAARLAVFTVSGASKVDAVRALEAGEDIPAARVTAATVVWLLDDAAAGVTP